MSETSSCRQKQTQQLADPAELKVKDKTKMKDEDDLMRSGFLLVQISNMATATPYLLCYSF